MTNKEFKINFLGVGVEKAGTSWVAECLSEHPEICFSKQKEVHFFNKNYEKGIGFYKKYFSECNHDKKIGEFTPRYFYDHRVPHRIKEMYPNIKIIICLRNPINRLRSHYYHNIAHGRLSKKTSIEKAIRENKNFINYGMYSNMLKKYFEIFPRENIMIVLYKDIKENPEKIIKKIYRFLGVKHDFVPQCLNKKVNLGSKKKYHFFFLKKALRNLICLSQKIKKTKSGNFILKILSKLGFKKLFQNIFRLNIKKKSRVKSVNKKSLSLEFKRKLISIYQEDIQKTNHLIEQDVLFWQKI